MSLFEYRLYFLPCIMTFQKNNKLFGGKIIFTCCITLVYKITSRWTLSLTGPWKRFVVIVYVGVRKKPGLKSRSLSQHPTVELLLFLNSLNRYSMKRKRSLEVTRLSQGYPTVSGRACVRNRILWPWVVQCHILDCGLLLRMSLVLSWRGGDCMCIYL